ncbi:MAG: hypothetical protein WCE50_05110 [Candidatus Acidiferrum sp.]
MLTFFTTAKPFAGHNGVIQRNALMSWKLLHPDVEVILFGDDQGAAAVAKDLGIRHEPHTEKNDAGSNRMDYMFARAQSIARHEVLCYSNCDIIFLRDLRPAVECVLAAHREFLMAGCRWDTEITEPWEFASEDWQERIRNLALQTGRQRPPDWIDYFVFSRGLLSVLQPLVIGRVFWDNWTVWKALEMGKPVVDASRVVLAIHQNHDYGHHPQGKQGVWYGEEAGANYKLAGGWKHLRTIADANEVLGTEGLKPNTARHWSATKRYVRQAGRIALYDILQPAWFFVLDVTRPLRNALGLRATYLRHSRRKA